MRFMLDRQSTLQQETSSLRLMYANQSHTESPANVEDSPGERDWRMSGRLLFQLRPALSASEEHSADYGGRSGRTVRTVDLEAQLNLEQIMIQIYGHLTACSTPMIWTTGL
jgi:hypothetical protein